MAAFLAFARSLSACFLVSFCCLICAFLSCSWIRLICLVISFAASRVASRRFFPTDCSSMSFDFMSFTSAGVAHCQTGCRSMFLAAI
eukprot:2814434-Alexandrium_andersonii.AAC.1